MNEVNPVLNSLVKDITEHLSQDMNRYNKFYNLLQRFQRIPQNPIFFLNSLKDILFDSPDLCNRIDNICQTFPPLNDPIINFSSFIDFANTLTESHNLGFIIAEVISFYIEELIPQPFVHYYISKLTPQLPLETQKRLHFEVSNLMLESKLHRADYYFSLSGNTILTSLPLNLNIEPLFAIPSQYQFLCMVHLLIPTQSDIECIIKCLKLYGSQMMNEQEASEWISQFDPFLKTKFIEISTENDCSTFHPTNLKLNLDDEIPKETQIWAFGKTLIECLDKATRITDAQMSNNITKTHSQYTTKHYHFIIFLDNKLNALYDEMKNIYEAIKRNKKAEISKEVYKIIYGEIDNQISPNLMIKRCSEIAYETIDSLVKYISKETEVLSPSSIEFRNNYQFLMRQQFIKKIIIFQGFETFLPKNLEIAFDLIQNFIDNFSKISNDFVNEFKKCFKNGIHYCSEATVLCIYYFLNVCDMINKIENIDEIKRIPKIVFDETVPLQSFAETAAANIDVPLLHFAKCAYKTKNVLFHDDLSSLLHNYNDIYFFEVFVEDGKIEISSCMNPTFDLSEENNSHSDQHHPEEHENENEIDGVSQESSPEKSEEDEDFSAANN